MDRVSYFPWRGKPIILYEEGGIVGYKVKWEDEMGTPTCSECGELCDDVYVISKGKVICLKCIEELVEEEGDA